MLDQRDMILFDALYAFFQEHQYCGELDGGVDGDRVWMTCTCGAVINRNAIVTDPRARRLVRVAALVHVATFG
jgi:hypothetical protein